MIESFLLMEYELNVLAYGFLILEHFVYRDNLRKP